MKPANHIVHGSPVVSGSPLKSRRRIIDAAGLALFHVAFLALVAASDQKQASAVLLLALPVLGLDVLYFFSPPKHRPRLEELPGAGTQIPNPHPDLFVSEYGVLLVPPAALISWFQSIIWAHRPLTSHELIALLVALLVVVGAISWIIYLRMTRCHIGIKNNATKFIAYAMLATWIGSTFLFVLLAGCLVFKYTRP